MAVIGDYIGDGMPELLIGSEQFDDCFTWTCNREASGVIAVLFGKPGGFGPILSLDDADIRWIDEDSQNGREGALGAPIVLPGDIDGDGFGDLLLLAAESSDEQYNGGEAYILFGGPDLAD